MRHDSKRIVGKNYRTFGDAPLYHHILRTLLACPSIDEIVVDTDSPVVRRGVEKTFPGVRVLERPEHLRDDHTPMNDVLLHTIDQVPAGLYLQTHSTNPLLTSETIETAIATYRACSSAVSSNRCDSLFGVTRLQQRLWTRDGRPVNHDPSRLIRTQDLEPLFIDNSCIYIFSAETLKAHKSRIGSAARVFEIDRLEALDIDEEADWIIAETLWKSRAIEAEPSRGALSGSKSEESPTVAARAEVLEKPAKASRKRSSPRRAA